MWTIYHSETFAKYGTFCIGKRIIFSQPGCDDAFPLLHILNISWANRPSYLQFLSAHIKISPPLLFCRLQVWNSPLRPQPAGWGRVDKVSRAHPDQLTAPLSFKKQQQNKRGPGATVMYSLFHLPQQWQFIQLDLPLATPSKSESVYFWHFQPVFHLVLTYYRSISCHLMAETPDWEGQSGQAGIFFKFYHRHQVCFL